VKSREASPEELYSMAEMARARQRSTLSPFVTLEGLDGCGKSTQLARLAGKLRAAGAEIETTREPGGTALGEAMRAVVVGDRASGLVPEAELALMCASRAQSVCERIRPALARGAWVLCDRFHDATEAYQGGGRGLDRGAIRELHRLLCGDLQPDLTLILELEPATCLARARRRAPATRFEREGQAFFQRVADVYREIAAREPRRCMLIAGGGSEDEVAQMVEAAVRERVGWPD
jgi:dTMP kinase